MKNLLIFTLLFVGLVNSLPTFSQGTVVDRTVRTVPVKSDNNSHLLFDGIPIDGSFTTFKKKILAKGYKYFEEYENTSEPAIWGKPEGMVDQYAGLFIHMANNPSKTIYGITAIIDKGKEYYYPIAGYYTRKFPSASVVYFTYQYDETPLMERTDRKCVITVPNKGKIILTDGLDIDENPVLEISFYDYINSQLPGGFADMEKAKVYDLSPFVTCVNGCQLCESEIAMEITGMVGGRQFRFKAEGTDQQLLRELIKYNGNREVKATLLNTYVYSVVRNKIPDETMIVTTKRMEKVIYAYVDAQRKAREQNKPTVRGVLWGMLKDYLYTPKEKAVMDRMIPKQTQERIFSGILGAVGGNGPTNFDMLSPEQQAVIHESSNGK